MSEYNTEESGRIISPSVAGRYALVGDAVGEVEFTVRQADGELNDFGKWYDVDGAESDGYYVTAVGGTMSKGGYAMGRDNKAYVVKEDPWKVRRILDNDCADSTSEVAVGGSKTTKIESTRTEVIGSSFKFGQERRGSMITVIAADSSGVVIDSSNGPITGDVSILSAKSVEISALEGVDIDGYHEDAFGNVLGGVMSNRSPIPVIVGCLKVVRNIDSGNWEYTFTEYDSKFSHTSFADTSVYNDPHHISSTVKISGYMYDRYVPVVNNFLVNIDSEGADNGRPTVEVSVGASKSQSTIVIDAYFDISNLGSLRFKKSESIFIYILGF